MQFDYQTFYHLNSELLVRYSRHGLNNGPFDEQIVLYHLNTKLVRYSDPYRITVRILDHIILSNGLDFFQFLCFHANIIFFEINKC